MLKLTFNLDTGDYTLTGNASSEEVIVLRAMIARMREALKTNPVSDFNIEVTGTSTKLYGTGNQTKISKEIITNRVQGLIQKLKEDKIFPF
jgi:Rod binding domain-containing protein